MKKNKIFRYQEGGNVNAVSKGYKDLRGYQKSGTIGSSLGTRTWTATDNKTVSETMSRPTRLPAKPLTSSTAGELRATTDKDRTNLKHYQALQLRETASPSGQLATWADNKLKHWEHAMGNVPGESLLATPMRMASSIGHSANRFSKALSGDAPVYNALAGTGNYAMASLDGLMLADGLGAAGNKLSTAALSNMKNSLPKGKLVMNKDRMMSGPMPTFSWKPYESSADDIISTQNMDTRLQAMYKKSRDAAFNANNYDYNEQTFLNENMGALQIHRANVAPGRSIYTLNPDDAQFANEFGNKKSLSELQQSLYNDYKNNTNFSNKVTSLGQSSPSSLSLEERLKAREFMDEYLEQLNSGVGRRQLESFDGMFRTNNLNNLQDNARYPIKLTDEIGDSYGSYTAFSSAKSSLNTPDQILNVLRVRPGISTKDLKIVTQHELGHNLQYNLPTLRGFGENSHANNANIIDLSNSIFDPATYHGLPQELSTWGNTIKNVGVNHNILKSTFDKVSPKQYGEIMETGDPWLKNFKKSMLPRREENHRFLLNFAY